MKMTLLELQTRIMEVIAELKTHEEHGAAIREHLLELIADMGED